MRLHSETETRGQRAGPAANLVELARGIRADGPGLRRQTRRGPSEVVSVGQEVEVNLAHVLPNAAVHENEEADLGEPEPVERLGCQPLDLV